MRMPPVQDTTASSLTHVRTLYEYTQDSRRAGYSCGHRFVPYFTGKPIKIEIVKDEDAPRQPAPSAPHTPSLLQRLGGGVTKPVTAAAPPQYAFVHHYLSVEIDSSLFS